MAPPNQNAKAAAPKPPARRGRRIFFTTFKWCRVAVLLLVLAVILLALFLHQVGLPVAFQRRVIERARMQGWDLEFSRLRLRWYDGVVADDLSLSRTNAMDGPHIFIGAARLAPRLVTLWPLNLRVESVRLTGGRVVWPVTSTNVPVRTFVLDDVRGELLFKPGDEWELRSLNATLMGARLHVRGDLTNASLLRDWKLPRREPADAEQERAFWNRLIREARQVRFGAPPEVSAIFSCDARDPRTLMTTLSLVAPVVQSPWVNARDVRLGAVLTPPTSNDMIHADLKFQMADANARWGSATNVELTVGLDPSFTHLVPTNASFRLTARSANTLWARGEDLVLDVRCEPDSGGAGNRDTRIDLDANRVRGAWGEARAMQFTGLLHHSATNFLPGGVTADIRLAAPRTRWVSSDSSRVNLSAELPAAIQLPAEGANLSWPDLLSNVTFRTITTVSNAAVWKLNFDTAQITNRWRPPRMETELSARLLDGGLSAETELDTGSRQLAWRASGQFFPRNFAPLVGTNVQPWLHAHQPEGPPRFRAAGTVILPAWTNRDPDWRGEVLPTLAVSGLISDGKATYRGVSYDSAHALFSMTNLVLNAPEVRITRPEGALEADYSGNEYTGDFRCRLRSTIDPKALHPLLQQTGAAGLLELFRFTQPPTFDGVFAGNRRDWKRLGMDADLALTNVAFRGEEVSSVTARLILTNQFLSILNPLVLRPGERGQADGIGINLASPRLYLTNATGRMTPHVVTRAIGPVVHQAVAAYIFDAAPEARVSGSIPLGPSDKTEDLLFEIKGGVFHWKRFNFDEVQATVHWRGESVTVTNTLGRWCGGNVTGWVFVDFAPTNTDLVSFHTYLQGASLKAIVIDLQSNQTSRTEGTLSGELAITRADLKDDLSWQGYGFANLTNGLIWDIPLFTVFSPVLNAFVPGLGNSRARHASLTYGITNSVIHSSDMEIHARLMRMQFRGSVDFEQRVDGRMEAELLRNVPGIGLVVSKVFWPVTKLFEYKITGTLSHPKTEQLYAISKVLLFPFQPIKTIRELFEEPDKTAGESPVPAPPSEPKPPASPP